MAGCALIGRYGWYSEYQYGDITGERIKIMFDDSIGKLYSLTTRFYKLASLVIWLVTKEG